MTLVEAAKFFFPERKNKRRDMRRHKGDKFVWRQRREMLMYVLLVIVALQGDGIVTGRAKLCRMVNGLHNEWTSTPFLCMI